MKKLPCVVLLMAVTLFTTSTAALADTEILKVEGVPNFHRVTDRFYRGAQPETSAWPRLAKLGVTTIVDLRQASEHSLTEEAKAVEAAGMRYVSIPTNGFALPTEDQVGQVLKLL